MCPGPRRRARCGYLRSHPSPAVFCTCRSRSRPRRASPSRIPQSPLNFERTNLLAHPRSYESPPLSLRRAHPPRQPPLTPVRDACLSSSPARLAFSARSASASSTPTSSTTARAARSLSHGSFDSPPHLNRTQTAPTIRTMVALRSRSRPPPSRTSTTTSPFRSSHRSSLRSPPARPRPRHRPPSHPSRAPLVGSPTARARAFRCACVRRVCSRRGRARRPRARRCPTSSRPWSSPRRGRTRTSIHSSDDGAPTTRRSRAAARTSRAPGSAARLVLPRRDVECAGFSPCSRRGVRSVIGHSVYAFLV